MAKQNYRGDLAAFGDVSEGIAELAGDNNGLNGEGGSFLPPGPVVPIPQFSLPSAQAPVNDPVDFLKSLSMPIPDGRYTVIPDGAIPPEMQAELKKAGSAVAAADRFLKAWQEAQEVVTGGHVVLGKRVRKQCYEPLLKLAYEAMAERFSVFEAVVASSREDISFESYIRALKKVCDDPNVDGRTRILAAEKILMAPVLMAKVIKKAGGDLPKDEPELASSMRNPVSGETDGADHDDVLGALGEVQGKYPGVEKTKEPTDV